MTSPGTPCAPDPAFMRPEGVPPSACRPRLSRPARGSIFLYPLHIRRIYLDGRPHPPEEQWIGTWFGHSVGHWEGDTLVIDTVDFNGLEWLGWPGWFTSPDKRVTERMRRSGNTLTWQATVEDSVILRPWTTATQTRQLNTNPRAEIEEPLPLRRERPAAYGDQGTGLTTRFSVEAHMRTHAIAIGVAVALPGRGPMRRTPT